MGLTARFAGRTDRQHSLRYAANCSILLTEAPWLGPRGSEVRDRTPPREPVCQGAPRPHEVEVRCSAAACIARSQEVLGHPRVMPGALRDAADAMDRALNGGR